MTGDSTRNAYFRLVEAVDAEIGKILDEIDSQDLWRNTVVIFTSDHGDGAGAHQWNQKTALYEESGECADDCLPSGQAQCRDSVGGSCEQRCGFHAVSLRLGMHRCACRPQRTQLQVCDRERGETCRRLYCGGDEFPAGRPARSAGWCAPRNTNTSFTTRGRTGSSFSTWRPTAGRCATLPWKRNTGMYFSSIVKCSASGLRHILQPR